MDLTPEYTEMCGKATEIQQMQPSVKNYYNCINYTEEGNWYSDKVNAWCVGSVNLSNGINDEFISDKKPLVWPPRQDQLQKMARGATGIAKLLFFYDFLDKVINGYNKGRIDEDNTRIIDKYTIEQLWLQYVMYEKYSKTWNGEEWI